MPIYEFECKKCHERYQIITSFNEELPKVCIKCGGELKKVFSPIGIIFKGSGFYTTDYKKKSSESDNKNEGKGKE
ncbi:MAG TPA: zinc ribbon domain-containing protein [Dictyoglomaceae bacterium]|nr:zinc ribbon domain-containing protein [Dictyoglomaceae bacterium]HOL38705.1 zinc ribbon domain-containing protein [Dictyoglomaceae bacterium]HOP94591.1 zinc ribbon domain-containing protein [Dictyoglomaceae bacterium]HPP15546.1 zinc ribbon domain-containing protein [Dictyoglomaceae bacterium]HPU42861.1 zinc ribbon domain-containing protein [Dictyoglomaceae bacterium]